MEAKKILMQLLKDKVMGCEVCMLHKGRNHVVFGNGDMTARLMIVNGAPGISEDDSGRVLMGETGAKLDKIFKYYKLKDKDVFITHAVCCRPPDDRDPLFEEEIEKCNHRLACQIGIIRPTIILSLGFISTQALLGIEICKNDGSLTYISDLFNTTHTVKVDDQEFPVIVSYPISRLLEESCDDSVKAEVKTHWDRAIGFLDIQNS